METQAAPTFEQLAELEPRLLDLLTEARTCPRTRGFCANARWYGYGGFQGRGLKARLLRLVGWHRPDAHEVLSSCAAYEVAYDTVFGALPDCSHVGPFC
jgi:hypothetical protein